MPRHDPPDLPPRPSAAASTGPRRRAATVVGLVAGAGALGIAAATLAIASRGDDQDGPLLEEAGDDIDIREHLEESDHFTLDPETGEVVPDIPAGAQPPEPGTPDRYEEPVSCSGFSPAVLDRLGGEVEPDDSLPAHPDHESVTLRCGFDGVYVNSYTFEATADGQGTAAVWEAFEFELSYIPGTPHLEVLDLGDGATVNTLTCGLVVADSNLAIRFDGTGGDPRTCGDHLTELAEDFMTQLGAR